MEAIQTDSESKTSLSASFYRLKPSHPSLYYQSEKQDFRRLDSYLYSQLRDGDRVFVRSNTYIPGILHYFGIYPKGRHYQNSFYWINEKYMK